MGRGKVELKRIENQTRRQVTFSKRRNGVLKKAFELSILCDAEVALLIFSSSGKVYQYASHDLDRIIGRYRREVGLPESNSQRSPTIEFWRNEIEDLKRSAQNLEARLRHLRGEDLLTLSMRELKQIEQQLKIGVERIRSQMRRIISEHINLLKRRHRALQAENARLQKEVKLLDEKRNSAAVTTPGILASSVNDVNAFPSNFLN